MTANLLLIVSSFYFIFVRSASLTIIPFFSVFDALAFSLFFLSLVSFPIQFMRNTKSDVTECRFHCQRLIKQKNSSLQIFCSQREFPSISILHYIQFTISVHDMWESFSFLLTKTVDIPVTIFLPLSNRKRLLRSSFSALSSTLIRRHTKDSSLLYWLDLQHLRYLWQ